MSKINKYNEFINNEDYIKLLIEKAEFTNKPDLVSISETENYRNIIKMGKKVIPLLLERNSIIWDIALKEITGDGISSLEYSTSERLKYWENWAKENGYKI
jgi:hypothetical protein